MKHLNYKSGHGTYLSSFYKDAKFQILVHINKVLLYNTAVSVCDQNCVIYLKLPFVCTSSWSLNDGLK